MSLFTSFIDRLLQDLRKHGGPLLLVIAGHNGAGKSSCYREYLQHSLAHLIAEHIDPDAIELEIRGDWHGTPLSDAEFSSKASAEAKTLRVGYLKNSIAFSMETVFSDPFGDKLQFLSDAVQRGYFVALLAVGLDSPDKSKQRVALRVQKGGHNVPQKKIEARYPRVIKNLNQAVGLVQTALVVDNSQDNTINESGAYFAFAHFVGGECIAKDANTPAWWDSESA